MHEGRRLLGGTLLGLTLAGAVLLVANGCWGVSGQDDGEVPAGRHTAADRLQAGLSAEVEVTRTVMEHPASRPTTTRPTAPQKEPEPAVIRGRCVAAETGKPLAGCEVFLVPMNLQGSWVDDNQTAPVFGRPLDYDSSEFSAHVGSIMLGTQHEYRPRGKPFPDLTLDRHFMTARRLAEVRRKGKHYQRPRHPRSPQ